MGFSGCGRREGEERRQLCKQACVFEGIVPREGTRTGSGSGYLCALPYVPNVGKGVFYGKDVRSRVGTDSSRALFVVI